MADFFKDIKNLDPKMAECPADSDGIAWHVPFVAPMVLSGFAWFDKDHKYERLPLDRPAEVTQFPNGVKTMVPSSKCGAFALSPNTAGGMVRFRQWHLPDQRGTGINRGYGPHGLHRQFGL